MLVAALSGSRYHTKRLRESGKVSQVGLESRHGFQLQAMSSQVNLAQRVAVKPAAVDKAQRCFPGWHIGREILVSRTRRLKPLLATGDTEPENFLIKFTAGFICPERGYLGDFCFVFLAHLAIRQPEMVSEFIRPNGMDFRVVDDSSPAPASKTGAQGRDIHKAVEDSENQGNIRTLGMRDFWRIRMEHHVITNRLSRRLCIDHPGNANIFGSQLGHEATRYRSGTVDSHCPPGSNCSKRCGMGGRWMERKKPGS
ncbi:hypothetical protein OPIT5_24125 [Opitutaceae bacterium TAV5]|nr:hypothetical protein OPIT5_24125 [Opitutaceae bacterium TAV5]